MVHDAALVGRSRLLVGVILGYVHTMVVWASHGAHWRNLCRFLTVELFLASRLVALASDRRAEVTSLVENLIYDANANGGFSCAAITLWSKLFELVLNVTTRQHTGDVHRFQDLGARKKNEKKTRAKLAFFSSKRVNYRLTHKPCGK